VTTVSAAPVKSASSKIRRIAGITTLVLLVGVLLLMFHRPAPVAPPMRAAEVAAKADSFQQKLSSLAPQTSTNVDAMPSSYSPELASEIQLSPEEVQAALVEANDPAYSAKQESAPPAIQTDSGEQVTLSNLAPVVTFENDVVKGQFQTELAGKAVVVTVSGHLGAKDGYATFDPTEFKIGDVPVPVSLVNEALQKKMLEQRDRMKLPDFISDIGVQNGQLVIKRK
jgi:hypothetical protein